MTKLIAKVVTLAAVATTATTGAYWFGISMRAEEPNMPVNTAPRPRAANFDEVQIHADAQVIAEQDAADADQRAQAAEQMVAKLRADLIAADERVSFEVARRVQAESEAANRRMRIDSLEHQLAGVREVDRSSVRRDRESPTTETASRVTEVSPVEQGISGHSPTATAEPQERAVAVVPAVTPISSATRTSAKREAGRCGEATARHFQPSERSHSRPGNLPGGQVTRTVLGPRASFMGPTVQTAHGLNPRGPDSLREVPTVTHRPVGVLARYYPAATYYRLNATYCRTWPTRHVVALPSRIQAPFYGAYRSGLAHRGSRR